MDKKKVFLILLIVGLVACFFAFDLNQYLTLEFIQGKRTVLADYYQQSPLACIGIYVIIYVAMTALSLPGAALATLVGGFLFGLGVGTVVVSFASTIGATLAFLVSRFLLRESLQAKFSDRLRIINEGIEKEGNFYLFTLRLIPAFPFFVINLVMGLTPIKTRNFFIISQLGMLPGTIIFVNTGKELGKIESLAGILSPQLILSFVLLGTFPLIVKKIVGIIKAKKEKSS